MWFWLGPNTATVHTQFGSSNCAVSFSVFISRSCVLHSSHDAEMGISELLEPDGIDDAAVGAEQLARARPGQ